MATPMQFGGWYNNPAQGGKNMRWWGGNTWTMGEDPTGGGGVNWQQSAPSTSSYSSPGGLESFTRGLMEARAGKESSLRGEEEGLFKQYEEKRSGQETLPALQTRLESQYNVPELKTQLGTVRGQVGTVKEQLDKLEGDITSRTEGSLVTEAQRRRMVEAEATPLRDTLARLASGQEVTAAQLADANATVGRQLELTAQQQNLDLQPILMRISAFSDRAARELAGFDQNTELQLNTYLDKLNRDRFLSDREWQATSDAATKEREFVMRKEEIQLQAKATTQANGGFPEMSFEEFKNTFGPAPAVTSGGTTSGFTGGSTGGILGAFQKTLDDIFGFFSPGAG
ncbi:MAG TPA: hypothetical protein VJ327_01325 [Patescibacteria group bacterium]|nr:hypothetical protein [Patescibacteria group bacterium]